VTAEILNAVEANEREFFLACAGLGEVEARPLDGAVLIDSGVEVAEFKGVFATTASPGDVSEISAAARAWFGERARPWVWRVGTAPDPAGVCQRLAQLGCRRSGDDPGMRAALDAALPEAATALSIKVVESEDDFEGWFEVFARGFDTPGGLLGPLRTLCSATAAPRGPMTHLIGSLEGRGVATSSMVVAAGSAGIFNVATLPDARRRGFGRDMTLAAMELGRGAGCRWAVLTASPSGLGVYRRLGFATGGSRLIYSQPAD
jgi:ribosomal protein S18 acetylase RimI-like enzyme